MAAVMMDARWREVFERQELRRGLVNTRADVNEKTSQKQKHSRTRVRGNMATMERAMLTQKGDARPVARCNGESGFNKHPAEATATLESQEEREGDEEDSVCS